MSFKTRIAIALLIVGAAAAAGGCGNYSNEDLDFINALPEQNDVATTIPTSSTSTANQAELYQSTHNIIGVFNGLVDELLSLIDGIRSYSPTSRSLNERIWGPVADKDHPGWEVRMTIIRADDLVTFNYAIEYRLTNPSNGPEDGWVMPALISGMFTGSQGVRAGAGTVTEDTSGLRAAGFPFEATNFLDKLMVSYNAGSFPVTIMLSFDNLPDPNNPAALTQGVYTYSAQQDGQGALDFNFFANSIPGPAAIEEFDVNSRWLGTGEGRADLQVVSGNGAGLQQTECWNSQFVATYNDKPWSTAEDVGGDPSVCPGI
jgi:hypothetical protein